jgi:hypothetical protein
MRQLLSELLLIVYCCILISCNRKDQEKFEFYYYPSANVYFDVANNLYLFSVDGGQTWDSIEATTDKQPALLGEKQVVYSATPAVWIDNREHRHEFNGQLIDVTSESSDKINKDLAADRKSKQPASSTSATKPTEKKPNFFQRLFGKKNKNKNDKN